MLGLESFPLVVPLSPTASVVASVVAPVVAVVPPVSSGARARPVSIVAPGGGRFPVATSSTTRCCSLQSSVAGSSVRSLHGHKVKYEELGRLLLTGQGLHPSWVSRGSPSHVG